MKKALMTGVVLLAFLGCSKQEDSPGPEDADPSSLSAELVAVEKYELKAGRADAALIQKGLKASVKALEEILADARKATPGLHGWFEGTLHIEPDGSVRMFAEGDSAIEQGGDAKIVDSFVGSVFGRKWSFPALGQDCLLYVKYRLKATR